MELIRASEIREDVRKVLLNTGVFMSAYQILEELPASLRDQLIAERGMPGQGSGNPYASASVVGDAARMLEGREIIYSMTRHLKFEVKGQDIKSGYGVCAFYRLNTGLA